MKKIQSLLLLLSAGSMLALAACSGSNTQKGKDSPTSVVPAPAQPVSQTSNTSSMKIASTKTVYDFEMQDIQGNPVSLGNYKGQALLIVNVASKCGLTPQYADLEELYKNYKGKGLTVLGFPANNFGAQEPGSNEEILTFCTSNYGVDFPMFAKISVKGEDQHPLYQYLTQKEQNGLTDAEVKWNFQKFLINREGKLAKVIPPTTRVNDPAFLSDLSELLN